MDSQEMMIENDLLARDIVDERVIRAMVEIPRQMFVDEAYKGMAYEDRPLPIGHGQTISQPYIVALMCQMLNLTGKEMVLEVGSGTGYQAAILSRLARKVIGVEILEALAKRARANLKKLNIDNVEIVVADGKEGYEKEAFFDAVVVAAVARAVPRALKKQLKLGGRLVMPLVIDGEERLIRITKNKRGFVKEIFGQVSFVPLV